MNVVLKYQSSAKKSILPQFWPKIMEISQVNENSKSLPLEKGG
jgi:hypothetical protein